MAQNWTPEIQGTDTITASRTVINNNFAALLSQHSGTAFPTTGLVVGMKCYRSDAGTEWRLKSLSPATWVKMHDTDNFDPNTKLDKSGGTMTGGLIAKPSTGTIGTPLTPYLEVPGDPATEAAAILRFRRKGGSGSESNAFFGLDTDDQLAYSVNGGARRLIYDSSNLVNPLTTAAGDARYMLKPGYKLHSTISASQPVNTSTTSTSSYAAKSSWLYINSGAIPSDAVILWHCSAYCAVEANTNGAGDAGIDIVMEIVNTAGTVASTIGNSNQMMLATNLTSNFVLRGTSFHHGQIGVNGYNYSGGIAMRIAWSASYSGNLAWIYNWYVIGNVYVPG